MLEASRSIGRSPAGLSPRWVGAILAFSDAVAVNMAVVIGDAVRFNLSFLLETSPQPDFGIMLFASVALVCINLASGLYPGYGLGAPERFRRQMIGLALVFVVIASWHYLLQHDLWLHMVTGFSFALALLLTLALGDLTRLCLRRSGRWGVPVAVLGTGASVSRLVRILREREAMGFIPVAVLSDEPDTMGASIAGLPVIGPLASAHRLAPEIRHVFVMMANLPPDRWSRAVDRLGFEHVLLVPEITGRRSLFVHARDLQGTLALEMADNMVDRSRAISKRVMDLAFASIFVLMFLPFTLLIAAAVKLTSRGPALFIQARVGRDGRLFPAYKFRTMVIDADARLREHLERHSEAKREYATFRKLRDDPRLTPVGAFLRRYSLDEWPQFINVLRGEMSLVGPRCYLPEEIPEMGGREHLVLRALPGITGWWQVSGRSDTTFSERVELDLYYIRNWSVSFDLYILYRTIWAVLSGRGAR